ncbi:hypothetical protein HPB50_014250 [Hyalomma asiaticum]|uniref:Uncharacterized protein n=1 Tax=Hyalomma asiaticum TaxID=266040 RepID=A0ACB7SCP0_HYAAI|nr:hypothetical protein HPB50_014250 [Hyalomma asiaticum]
MQWDQMNVMLATDVPSLASVLLVMLLGVTFNLALALIMDDLLPLSTNIDGPRLFRTFSQTPHLGMAYEARYVCT